MLLGFDPAVTPTDCRLSAGQAAARPREAGMTLGEVLIATAIVALVFGGIIVSYIQSGMRVQWSGYALAAQSLANEVLEQARSATWDPTQTPPVNNLTNMNLQSVSYNAATLTYSGYSTAILDVPYASTNYILATNYVTLQTISVNGNAQVQLQFLRVDTVWPFSLRQANLFFTNTVCTMIAPDNRALN
jgi:Tfp pilus assembly protein PilV